MYVDIGKFILDRSKKRGEETAEQIAAAINIDKSNKTESEIVAAETEARDQIASLIQEHLHRLGKPHLNEGSLEEWLHHVEFLRDHCPTEEIFKEQVASLFVGVELYENKAFEAVEPLVGATIGGELQAQLPAEDIRTW